MQQYKNNQQAYAAKGWPTYPNGGYNTTRVAEPLTDWVKGDEPCYEPIAGGKGWGNKICGNGQSSSSPDNSTAPVAEASSVPVSPSSTPASQPDQGTKQAAGQGESSPELASSSALSSVSTPSATVGSLKYKPQDKEEEQDDCEL